MSTLYIKGARASSHCAEERHLCSMLRHRRARSSRFPPNHGLFRGDCPWHQTCLLFRRELVWYERTRERMRSAPGWTQWDPSGEPKRWSGKSRMNSIAPNGGSRPITLT